MIEVDFVKKRWIMIFICLFIMISLSAVSASESVENQTFSSDNDAINVLGISSNNIISTSSQSIKGILSSSVLLSSVNPSSSPSGSFLSVLSATKQLKTA